MSADPSGVGRGAAGDVPTVVLTDADRFPLGGSDRDRLQAAGLGLAVVPGHSAAEIRPVAERAAAVLVYSARIDDHLLDRLSSCRLLVRCGSGYDNIDVAGARRRGIEVAYVPGYGTDDVAEHALALILACARRLVEVTASVRGGHWPTYPQIGTMHRLRGQTLGLVGFGRIARRLGEMGRALGLEVVAYDPMLDAETFVAAGVRRVSLEELARVSSVVSLHAPLSRDTAGMIDDAFLRAVTPGTVLVNTSRGELVDETALLAALDDGRLAAAGLDVLVTEPPPADSPLVAHPRTVVTSHTAAFTEEALAAVASLAVDEVVRVLAGEPPRHPVPDPV